MGHGGRDTLAWDGIDLAQYQEVGLCVAEDQLLRGPASAEASQAWLDRTEIVPRGERTRSGPSSGSGARRA